MTGTATETRRRGHTTDDATEPAEIVSAPGQDEFNLAWNARESFLTLHLMNCPINLTERGKAVVLNTYGKIEAGRIAAISKTEPFVKLWDLQARRASAAATIEASAGKIAKLKTGDAVDAKSASALRVAIEEVEGGAVEAALLRDTINRRIDDARAECRQIVEREEVKLSEELSERLDRGRRRCTYAFYAANEPAFIEFAALEVAANSVDTLAMRMRSELLGE